MHAYEVPIRALLLVFIAVIFAATLPQVAYRVAAADQARVWPATLAIALAITYLLAVRTLDINEKRSVWGIGVLFALGAAAGTMVYLTVDSRTLRFDRTAGPMLQEAAKFVVISVGIAMAAGIDKIRGRSGLFELHEIRDGIIYGTAAGLGFGTGAAYVHQGVISHSLAHVLLRGPRGPEVPGLEWVQGLEWFLWSPARLGVFHGLLGAILGFGFGLAANASRPARRYGAPIAGLIGAVVVHFLYTSLQVIIDRS